jgi:putative SOS response-associated peptidase YedK
VPTLRRHVWPLPQQAPAAEIARIFRTGNPLPNYPARYNIAPTDQVLTVRFNAKTQERTLDARRWGASMNARLQD